MKNLKFLILFMVLAFSLPCIYGGCGGGGGGSESSGGISYSGLAAPAEISELNAEDIAGGAFGAGLIGDGMMGLGLDRSLNDNYVGEFRTVKIPLILRDSLDLIDFAAPSMRGVPAALQTETDTINGDCGGSMTYTVSADVDEGTFSGSFTFSSYCNGGTIISGSASFDGRMNMDTSEFVEAHLSFNNLSGGDLVLSGDIDMDFSVTPNVTTFDAYGQDPGSGKVFWIRDYTIVIDEGSDYIQITMDGRFYHPDYGYVTLSTTDPFVLYSGDEWPTSGSLVVTGAGDSRGRITAIDNTYCKVEADVDGDNAYEWETGSVAWDDI